MEIKVKIHHVRFEVFTVVTVKNNDSLEATL
jgi:hypothetical protein